MVALIKNHPLERFATVLGSKDSHGPCVLGSRTIDQSCCYFSFPVPTPSVEVSSDTLFPIPHSSPLTLTCGVTLHPLNVSTTLVLEWTGPATVLAVLPVRLVQNLTGREAYFEDSLELQDLVVGAGDGDYACTVSIMPNDEEEEEEEGEFLTRSQTGMDVITVNVQGNRSIPFQFKISSNFFPPTKINSNFHHPISVPFFPFQLFHSPIPILSLYAVLVAPSPPTITETVLQERQVFLTWTQPPEDIVDEYYIGVSTSPIGCGVAIENVVEDITGSVKSFLSDQLEEYSITTIVVLAVNINDAGESRETVRVSIPSARKLFALWILKMEYIVLWVKGQRSIHYKGSKYTIQNPS